MADNESTGKRPKRRLKVPSETVRERQTTASVKAAKPKNKLVRRGFGALGAPFRAFVGLGVWQTAAWKPFRLIGKVVGRILLPKYVRNSFAELKLVTWPDRRQSVRLTMAVLGFSIVFGVVIAGVDFGLDKLFREVLLK